MTDEQKTAPQQKSYWTSIWSIPAWFIGAAFGKWAGINFLIPLVFWLAANFTFGKFPSERRDPIRALLAAQIAQMGWLSLGMFVTGGFGQVVGDLIVLGGLLYWTWTRPGKWSFVSLIVAESLFIALNIYNLSEQTADSAIKALCVHILWRLLIIGLSIAALRNLRSKIASNVETIGPGSDDHASVADDIPPPATENLTPAREKSRVPESNPEAIVAKAIEILKSKKTSENIRQLLNEFHGDGNDVFVSRTAAVDDAVQKVEFEKIDKSLLFNCNGRKIHLIVADMHPATDNDLGKLFLIYEGEYVLGNSVYRDMMEWGYNYRINFYPFSIEKLKLGPWVDDLGLLVKKLADMKQDRDRQRQEAQLRATASKIDLGDYK